MAGSNSVDVLLVAQLCDPLSFLFADLVSAAHILDFNLELVFIGGCVDAHN